MHATLEKLCSSLDSLSKKIIAGFGSDVTLAEHFGWNHPALTKHDLAALPNSISHTLRELNPDQMDPGLEKIISGIPAKLTILENNNLPHFFSGNGTQAIPQFLIFMDWIQMTLSPLTGWIIMTDTKSMPAQIGKRVRAIQSQLDALIPDKESIEKQISLINDATTAAESLPEDLDSLAKARKKIDTHQTESARLFGQIDKIQKDSELHLKSISERKIEADKLVAQCEEAYKITTSKGLAGAFDERSNKLNISMWLWVGGLLIALGIGAFIGSQRVDMLSGALKDKDPNMLIVWTNLVLSVFSIGAPIWFAWIATKQIAQRFKLAEDYAFKASIAKAYEGYRKEAARIDPQFEARLFSSALTRLEEPPLRVMEHQNFGTPWQELFQSTEFKDAISQVPSLKDKILTIAKKKVTDEKLTSE